MSRGTQEKRNHVSAGESVEPWCARLFEVFFLAVTGIETRVVKDSEDFASIDFMVFQGDELIAWVEVTKRNKYDHEFFKQRQAARYHKKVDVARERDLPCYLVQATRDAVFLLYDLKNPSTTKPFKLHTYQDREEQWVHGWDYDTLIYKFVLRDDEGRLKVGDIAKSNPVLDICKGPGRNPSDYWSYSINDNTSINDKEPVEHDTLALAA